MWGGVGRGKTWLMYLFYRSLPGVRKMRLQGHQDPLEIISDAFKVETDVLYFDEFFVTDITDAMLLGTHDACTVCARDYACCDLKHSAG